MNCFHGRTAAPARRLAGEEKAAWDNFIRMQEKLIGRLSRHVRSESGMSASDYVVLAGLTERGGGRIRLLDLARKECPDDGRGAFIVATPAGHQATTEAAGHHVEHVRRLFIDALTPSQLKALARISEHVLAHMEKQSD
ncbi:MarR family transcriptional regulator [Streptomyces beigongshangae]|uniref:MarR family transcriptional regulator n=1 Tax=Streptomyces beigongshangae TaxID=2841597 RepID=UPI001C860739|nr:MarR family transcriptional regulator [Streptomyces sp. REN17]